MKNKILMFLGIYFGYVVLTLLIFYLNESSICTNNPSLVDIVRIFIIPILLTILTLINIWFFTKKINFRKKYILIGIILFIISLGFITGFVDYNRIKGDKKPLFVIPEIDKSGPEISYYGLNYKIVRNPGVSYKDDLSHDVYVKFGFWFYTWIIKTNM